MELTVATILVAFAGVFLICFMKGAFGGGFSIVGIPLLSIVMDPVTLFVRPTAVLFCPNSTSSTRYPTCDSVVGCHDPLTSPVGAAPVAPVEDGSAVVGAEDDESRLSFLGAGPSITWM